MSKAKENAEADKTVWNYLVLGEIFRQLKIFILYFMRPIRSILMISWKCFRFSIQKEKFLVIKNEQLKQSFQRQCRCFTFYCETKSAFRRNLEPLVAIDSNHDAIPLLQKWKMLEKYLHLTYELTTILFTWY